MKKIAIVSGGAGLLAVICLICFYQKVLVIVIDGLSGGHKKNIAKHLNAKNLILIKKNIIDLKYKDLRQRSKIFFSFCWQG